MARPLGSLVGRVACTWGVERVAEEDERRVVRVRLGGGKAGDPAAVRLAADRDRGAVWAGPSGTIARIATTASSAFLSGRSIASASIPRRRRPATWAAMLAAFPLAP